MWQQQIWYFISETKMYPKGFFYQNITEPSDPVVNYQKAWDKSGLTGITMDDDRPLLSTAGLTRVLTSEQSELVG